MTDTPTPTPAGGSGLSARSAGGNSTLGRAARRAPSTVTRGGTSDLGRRARAPRRGRYAAMIGVEYLACMILIVVSAGLVGRERSSDVLADPAIVLARLTAVSFLFFLLALLAVGEHMARLSATFGALVTTGVLLNSAGGLRQVGQIFGGGSAKSSTPPGADTYGGGPTPGPVQA